MVILYKYAHSTKLYGRKKMDKFLASLLIVLALLIGVVGGIAVDNDLKVVTQEVEKEVIVSHTEVVNVSVADTSLLLDQAVSDFLAEVEDKSSLRKCDGDKYSLSEISVDNVKDKYSVSLDEDEKTVDFKVELRYKESDLRSCYDTYSVEAHYEDGEDVEVSVN